MCGIIGFTGCLQAAPILLNGLQKLEYRGYDSAGIACMSKGGITVSKAVGRIDNLRGITNNGSTINSTMGIGHTRWATHGKPSDVNSHPHVSMNGKFAVVHNGIIENFGRLKEILISKGFKFQSETDTEVVAHMLEYYYRDGNILHAIARTMNAVEGSYALGILCDDDPDHLYCAKKDSPLIIGLNDSGNYIASDVTALVEHTKTIVYMDDFQIGVIGRGGISIYNRNEEEIEYEVKTIDWNVNAAEKGGYEHFMMKEIIEQPKVLRDTIRPRLKDNEVVLDDFSLSDEQLKSVDKVYITACGSAYHAGMVGKYVIERLCRLPVEIDVASEFRYRDPIVTENTLVVVISQSGETADTLAALKEAKEKGAHTLAIVNVVSSAIAKAADDVLYTWAGPEIAVATTKAYSAQLAALYLLAIYIGRRLGRVDDALNAELISQLNALPEKVETLINDRSAIQNLATVFYGEKNMFFIGRNIDYASALEGSLKLKEISYIHSEAYAAGELKHGTISLIEEGRPVIALACQNALADKLISNVREVKARGALVIGLSQDDMDISESVDYSISIPSTHPLFTASLSVIPLQLFGYYVAASNGCDIDKPRNLAKSVTVE